MAWWKDRFKRIRDDDEPAQENETPTSESREVPFLGSMILMSRSTLREPYISLDVSAKEALETEAGAAFNQIIVMLKENITGWNYGLKTPGYVYFSIDPEKRKIQGLPTPPVLTLDAMENALKKLETHLNANYHLPEGASFSEKLQEIAAKKTERDEKSRSAGKKERPFAKALLRGCYHLNQASIKKVSLK